MTESNIVYKAMEVIGRLGLKASVFKKYISLLEKEGISFQRNQQGHRIYTEDDVKALEMFIEWSRYDGMTLEGVAKKIGELKRKNEGHDSMPATESKGYDVMTLTNELLKEQEQRFTTQLQGILQQYEQKAEEREQRLLERIDRKEEYLRNSLEKRDQLFLENIRETQALKEVAAVSQETGWSKFWQFLKSFGSEK